MKKLFILNFLIPLFVIAQNISGTIQNESGEKLKGVNIFIPIFDVNLSCDLYRRAGGSVIFIISIFCVYYIVIFISSDKYIFYINYIVVIER